MAKCEVQVRHCLCCGLSPGALLIGVYSLLLYALLTALASWGISDTSNYGDASHFTSCELEAQGKINADNRKLAFHTDHATVIVEDSTSYHCSFGLYTEELKFAYGSRYPMLVFDLIVYVPMILASLLLIAGVVLYSQWLLIPWLILMAIDIIRGTISTLFIFVLTYGNLARIATAIFFLGLQTLHAAFWLIILAKFQRIHNRKTGVVHDQQKGYYDPRYPPPGATSYGPSAYSPGQGRRDVGSVPGGGPPGPYPYSDYSLSQKEPVYGAGGGPRYGGPDQGPGGGHLALPPPGPQTRY